jgi:photosystem II stability/assembly factor-like uncharacterized protein
MKPRLISTAATTALLLCLGSGWAPAAQAASGRPTSDPLLLPAAMSERAAHSVLMAVARAGDHLVAVGERGVILVSSDHGRSWQQAKVPVSVTLTSVNFASPLLGWAVGHGGVILHSADGGRTWAKQLDGVGAAQAELAAATQEAGDDDASQRRLRDAKRVAEEGPDKPFLDVRFWSPADGVVVGAYGALLRTHDGGQSWVSARGGLSNPKGKHLYSIQVAGDELYITGEQGSLFRSRDHGRHFDVLTTPYKGTFFGVVAVPGQELLAYGLRGHVFRSTDEGVSWERQDIGQAITVTSGQRRPDGTIVLVDESGRVLLRPASGGVFKAAKLPQPFSFTSVASSADGGLVLTGIRGGTRIAPDQLTALSRP